ncbi:MAG: glycosyltransferase family 2 protein [Firmicutes bacterium]|nr:glycosyltransferase family 2 protein [Bacillota bacterium]
MWLPPVSVIIPAHNEEKVICNSLRSVLRSRYPVFEVIVVSDGSTDRTLEVLREEFHLVRTTRPPLFKVPCRPTRAAFVSATEPRLLVVDKENGGRADALNAGLAFSRYHLVVCIDADSVVEPDSLLRCARPFSDPRTQAAGGVIRVLNGCRVVGGHLVEPGLPGNPLVVMQAVEYARAFFTQRPAFDTLGSLPIISGSFGMFRRQTLIEVGGFSNRTVAEDMELVLRLHHHFRSQPGRRAYRQVFVPDPVVWTEVPETIGDLGRQRRRWQRGLAQALWAYRHMLFRPRFGWLGMVVLPYYWLYELLEPVILALGYVLTVAGVLAGWLHQTALVGLFLLPVSLNLVISLMALFYGELPFGRYQGLRDLARLVFWSFTEPFWYRWLSVAWRLAGLWDALRAKQGWEKPERVGAWAVSPHDVRPGRGSSG